MENLLGGKNVFISGAGPNIGRAIALEMAAAGATIYFAEKNEANRTALTSKLSERGFASQSFLCDVSQPDEIDEVLAQLEAQKIAIDVLVNNAGIHEQHLPAEMPQFERWQRMMDTNVLGPLYLSRRLAEKMIESGTKGNIIFISSIHQDYFNGDTIYSASKAALSMIIKELAVSFSPHDIRVNGIAPGYCLEGEEGDAQLNRKIMLEHQPVEPCHIGRAALFLASEFFSAQTTGTTLVVDGGLSLYSFHSQNVIDPAPAPSTARRIVRRGKLELKQLRDRLR